MDSYQPISNSNGPQDRYSYAIVEHHNQKKFLKTSLQPTGIGDIRREVVWADFMAFVEEYYPESQLRAPHECQLLNENRLLMEYIQAPVVARSGDGTAWKRNMDRYVEMLIVLDQAAGDYVVPDNLRGYRTRTPGEAMSRWLRYADIKSDLKRGYDYVMQNESLLDYRVQHGDLTPWQIFDVGHEWIIFDGERAGDDLPRYNDLAYSYGRMAIKCGDIDAADYMIGQFMARQGMSEANFWRGYLPVAVFRILGMVGDAIKDNSEAHERRARALLRSHLDVVGASR